MRTLTFAEAMNRALADEMRLDSRTLYMATNPPDVLSEFGPERVRVAPIAESAMTGMAVGAAGSGFRPIVGWGNVTFSFVAFDQTVNQVARIRYMSGGQRDFPMVFIAQYLNGTRSAAQHCHTGFALYAHAGGLKIAAPSNARDASGLMRSAVRDNNPVLYLYADRLSDLVGELPDAEELVPFGVGTVTRPGRDVTIVGIGYMVNVALDAAKELAEEGIEAEVLDPRSLVPLDIDLIMDSVKRTGRLIVVDESFPTCSFASEIAALVAQDPGCFSAMTAPARCVTTAPVPVPYSPPLEDFVLPDKSDVINAARAACAFNLTKGSK